MISLPTILEHDPQNPVIEIEEFDPSPEELDAIFYLRSLSNAIVYITFQRGKIEMLHTTIASLQARIPFETRPITIQEIDIVEVIRKHQFGKLIVIVRNGNSQLSFSDSIVYYKPKGNFDA